MNDERPIEKLLRRAAQKRSAESGLPPELHPVNRRLLQDEVARQFPKTAASPPPAPLTEWWTGLKRRWVYGVGVFAALWIVALIVVPLFSKPKSKELLAQTTANEIAALLAAKKDSAASSPVIIADSAVEDRNPATLATSEKTQQIPLPTPAIAPGAPEAIPEREIAAPRQVRHNNGFAQTDTIASLNPSSPAMRTESKTKADLAKIATDTLYQPTPSSSAPRNQLENSSRRFGSTATAKSAAATTAPSGAKPESRAFAAANVTTKRELAAPALASTVAEPDSAPTEVAAAITMDKSWLPRGGGAERTPVERSSQTYANLAGERSTRKKDVDAQRTAPRVLLNFRIEQAGRDVRVVDGDGSVYTGVVDEKNTRYKQQLARQNLNLSNTFQQQFNFQPPKLTSAPAPTKALLENYYSYRVEGTNRTLNQNVVFTWNFVATNALAAGSLNGSATTAAFDTTPSAPQFSELLQKSFINGRAQFGSGRELEVNAVPVQR